MHAHSLSYTSINVFWDQLRPKATIQAIQHLPRRILRPWIGHTILLNQKYEKDLRSPSLPQKGEETTLNSEKLVGRMPSFMRQVTELKKPTVNNTALSATYRLRTTDLTAHGGSSSGWIYDSVVQELNVTSGHAIWTWKASNHIDPEECMNTYAWRTYSQTGDDHDTAWNYFHINSIEKDNSENYPVSSQHCSTIYLDGSDEQVIWRLGGREFSFIVFHGNRRISLFNNAGLIAGVYSEDCSRLVFIGSGGL
ncbi:hypothetical protein Moror_11649 [Moniliophthora roreri MCA 2997]|uniref:Uncharacterized protein n=1 Tax=Moniliophthora roreri (strain MCA 2997) TaxID=1381753 RepID=V2Y6X6_MONRO|nr:hypothetical protein Moror_11649 [Moniliophthora roreri MCA 2997]